ncbi:MAG: hypothetical protein OIN87_09805 [Candidatus Methanoperedens sp.]|nr:hypothetical protein [Candidatus Methanoperedens sp.]
MDRWEEEMLETPKERIKLLKAGITGNQIEELYILYNNFKVVWYQRPLKKLAINTTMNMNDAVCQEVTVKIINKDRIGMGLLCPTLAQ